MDNTYLFYSVVVNLGFFLKEYSVVVIDFEAICTYVRTNLDVRFLEKTDTR